MEYLVTTFYKFLSLNKGELFAFKRRLEEQAALHSVLGLVLVAEEGVNATIAADENGINAYKAVLTDMFGEMKFKDSGSEKAPFRRFKVKIKKEIVQLGRGDIQPRESDSHLSPEQWDTMVQDKNVVLIDVRNWYETKIGKFKNAVDPKTWKFSQYPAWLKKSGIPKDATVGIYCTGGIRCEKAAVAMQEQGYKNVHQLDGGILNYIAQFPERAFEGDCFVFDHRVAVGQDLKPSQRYERCWMCGNAGLIDKDCVRCGVGYRVCDDCLPSQSASVCSKQCRHIQEKDITSYS